MMHIMHLEMKVYDVQNTTDSEHAYNAIKPLLRICDTPKRCVVSTHL